MVAAAGFTTLTQEEVNKLKSVEGNGYGSGVLAAKVDSALGSGTTNAAAAAAASTAAAAAQTTANAALPAAKLLVLTGTVAAGSATVTAAVTGLLTTDTVLAVSQKAANVNSLVPVAYTVNGTNNPTVAAQLPLIYSADPGASGTVAVAIKRA